MGLTNHQILAFLNIKGLGLKTGFTLAEHAMNNELDFCNANDLFDYFNMLRNKKIISRVKIESLYDLKEALKNAERLIEKSEEQGIKLVTFFDKDFPKRLRGLRNSKGNDESPLVLWYKGNLSVSEMPSVAIIGTREPTNEGVKAGNYLGMRFAESGFNVVSGLAYGCDKSGHEGALLCTNGKTTAFLAHGLDTVYPNEHKYLADEIVERGGLLMSEYAIGTPGLANYFVARDRLQSGLSDACIVIQTGIAGGTLHAVRATIANNKPLFAVEYKDEHVMSHPKVLGNKMLLEDGILVGNNLAKASRLVVSELDNIIISLKNQDRLCSLSNQDTKKNVVFTPIQTSLFD